MDIRKAILALSFAALCAATVMPASSRAADIVIATGSDAQVHYGVARAICRHLHKTGMKSGGEVTCEAIRIEGRDAEEAVAVMSEVRTVAIEVGLVQSNWQYYAVEKSGPMEFMDIGFDNLQALFSLHGEPFTIVARRDAGIDSLDDLAGKRVNIGNPGSSQRAFMDMVMAAKGWTRSSFQLADELSETEQSLALCHDRVQAMVSTVAHPNPAIKQTIELCDAKIVEVSSAEIGKLISEHRYLSVMDVPGGFYKGIDKAVQTFGVTVTALSSEDVSEDLTYEIVKSVFGNLEDFKRLHPALITLSPERMTTDGISAPMHAGALRYFREQGMM